MRKGGVPFTASNQSLNKALQFSFIGLGFWNKLALKEETATSVWCLGDAVLHSSINLGNERVYGKGEGQSQGHRQPCSYVAMLTKLKLGSCVAMLTKMRQLRSHANKDEAAA